MSDFPNKKENSFINSKNETAEEVYSDFVEDLVSFKSKLKKSKLKEKRVSLEDTITEKEGIKNIGRRQDINLKKKTLAFLCGLLSIETIVIFLFSFFQATKYPMSFHLEEWSFKLLVAATISQITIMLLIAVKHLFPDQK